MKVISKGPEKLRKHHEPLKQKRFLYNPSSVFYFTARDRKFIKPRKETKFVSKNQKVGEIGGKVTAFDWGGEMTFGSSYRSVLKTD